MIVAHVTRSTPPRVGLIRLVPQGTWPWLAIRRRPTNQQPQTINQMYRPHLECPAGRNTHDARGEGQANH